MGSVVYSAEATRLTIGIPEGLPGYKWMPGGDLIIADRYKQAITQCIEKDLGVKFRWVAFPTNRALYMLKDDVVDLLYPMGFTEERAAAMQESLATWENPDVWLSWTPVALDNKETHIAAKIGSPQHTEYVSEGYARLSPAYTYEDLPKLLSERLVEAVIVPKSVFMENKGSWPRGIVVTNGKPRKSGFYLNKTDPKKLLARLNAGIARCVQKVR